MLYTGGGIKNGGDRMLDYENLSIETLVYESLTGELLPEYALDWVEDIFVPGHPCYEEYRLMREAYQRICTRLGNAEEDQDLEIMVNALLNHCRIIATEMFRYGRMYRIREEMK